MQPHLFMYVRQTLYQLPEETPNAVHIQIQSSIYTVTQRALLTKLHL